jgi:hypothetical protein
MTAAGWILMIVSVSSILAFTAYCFYRVLRAPVTKDHLHAPLDIETGDNP